jgi:hypothetical protein
MDHSILELTRIKETVGTISEIESEHFAERALSARTIIKKWLSQIKDGPNFCYTVMISRGTGMDEFEVIEDIPSSHIRHRNKIPITSDENSRQAL